MTSFFTPALLHPLIDKANQLHTRVNKHDFGAIYSTLVERDFKYYNLLVIP